MGKIFLQSGHFEYRLGGGARCAMALTGLWLLVSCLLAAGAPVTGVSPNGLEEIRALLEEKASWTPAQSKMESQLIHAMKSSRGQSFAPKAKNLRPDVTLQPDRRVQVDIRATVTPRLVAQIKRGGEVINSFPQFRAIRAVVTLEQMERLAGLPEVSFIRRAEKAHTNTGAVDTQGDATHRAAAARAAFATSGAGIKVGVLSDSADFLENSQASADLGPVTILPGQRGSGNGEGTAALRPIGRDLGRRSAQRAGLRVPLPRAPHRPQVSRRASAGPRCSRRRRCAAAGRRDGACRVDSCRHPRRRARPGAGQSSCDGPELELARPRLARRGAHAAGASGDAGPAVAVGDR